MNLFIVLIMNKNCNMATVKFSSCDISVFAKCFILAYLKVIIIIGQRQN